MPRQDLKTRADSLRAEAAAARRDLDGAYESSRAELRRQLMQVTREDEVATYGAERAQSHARGSRIEAEELRRIVEWTEQQAVNEERDGKIVEAEETREVAG